MPPYARLHTAPHYSSRPEAARSRNQRVTQALSRFLPDDLSHFDGGRELPSTRDAAPCISALSGARDTRDHKFSRKPRGLRSMESVLCAQARAPARARTRRRTSPKCWPLARARAPARARTGTPAVSKPPPRAQPPARLPHIHALRCPARTRARTPAHERPHTNSRTRTPTHERPHHTTRRDRA